MKRLAFVIIFILFTIYATGCSLYGYNNPYKGVYVSSNSTILKLKGNNRCEMVINLYKNAFYADGKYTVKDNNISIIFDKNQVSYYGIRYLSGKFEGDRLSIYFAPQKKYYVYIKK